jgi:exosortase A
MAIVPKVFVPSKTEAVGEASRQSSAVTLTASSLPTPWRSALVWAVLAWLAALVLFRQTAWLIGETWSSSRTFSHGFLILPIFLYLVWIRRGPLLALRPKPSYWMLGGVALLAGVWLVGNLGDVNVVEQFALVAMLEAILWAVLGTAVVRVLWFPLLFLFFAVPFGETAIGPLQDFTAHFAVACLKLSHVPVILENRTISVPSGPWVVAEACSGIRYLISSLVLGLVYASLMYRSRRRRALFVLASVIVPVVANGFRAYGIILLANLTNNRVAVGVDHILYGWIFFTVIQLLLFTVGLRWREAGWTEPTEGEIRGNGLPQQSGGSRAIAAAALCAMVVAAWAPGARGYLWKRADGVSPQPSLVVNAPWQQIPVYYRDWAPELNTSSEFRGSYASGGHTVDVYLARFSGRQGVELVSGYNQISNPRAWTLMSSGFRNVTVNGQRTRVSWDVMQSGMGPRMVWMWYWTGEKPTSDPMQVKLAQTKARLLGKPLTIAVMTISTQFLGGPDEGAEQLQEFLNHSSVVFNPTPAGK